MQYKIIVHYILSLKNIQLKHKVDNDHMDNHLLKYTNDHLKIDVDENFYKLTS